MPQKRATFISSQSSDLKEAFINCLMLDGKKSVARRVLKDCFEVLQKKDPKKNIEELFEFAVRNVMPNIEVRPKRVGGAIYQIPVEVHPKRQQTLAMRWIIQAARAKKGMPMADRLALELVDASNDTGTAFKKKENVKAMAKANKAFAHYARF